MDMLNELADIPIFQDLDEQTLNMFAPLFERCACPAGTVIFEQGAPASHLYLLLQGTVTVRYKPYDGPPLTLTQLTSGGVFGWSAVVGNPYYTSATLAKDDVTTLRMRATDLHHLVLDHPEEGQVLLDKLARKVSNRWADASRQVRRILDKAIRKEPIP